MHALAGERVQIRRQRRHQRLALAGAHFGDLAGMQRQAADQLHVEMAQPELAARRLAHQRKRLGNQIDRAAVPAAKRALSSRVFSGNCSSGKALTLASRPFIAATVRLSSFTRR